MRVGIMGGTFDPIHIGHLIAASEVCTQLKLDQVVFIPAGQPWQKSGQSVTAARVRLETVRAAVSSDARFDVDDIEVRRTGATYAVETMKDLTAKNPDNEYFWIVGDDVLEKITTWHHWQEFLDLVQIVAVNRTTDKSLTVPFDYIRVVMPEVRISASELRHRLAQGDDCRYLIPDAARDYIMKNGIYRS
jgi:nicotinate-nucleotide adenylyltransferase